MDTFIQPNRVFELIFLIIIFLSMYVSVRRVKRGWKPELRKIVGIEAIKDLVGRAVEMGGKIHFTPGVRGALTGERAMDTIVGLSVLGHVAELAAKNDVPLTVSTAEPDTFTVACAMVSQGNLAAGKPNREVDVRFFGSGFAMVSGTLGVLARENVVSNIMIGTYGADALIMAESANRYGIMQVGGCATPGNLPFFMAVCDYYLMGEEIYAASAWTSGNMEDLGVVVGEDYPKLLSMILIIIGAILTTIGSTIIQSILQY